MPMYNEFQFTRDFIQAYPAHTAQTSRKQLSLAYAYYMHGYAQGQGGKGLTLGLCEHLADATKKYGSVLDGAADGSNHNPEGQVFTTSRGGGVWQVFYNDSFVLGGVHSHAKAVLVGLNKLENRFMKQLVDKGQKMGFTDSLQLDFEVDKYGLRVTQREILGLTEFGYTRGSVGGETVFTCVNKSRADGATLYAYERLISGLVTAMGFPDYAHAKAAT